jgi:hypothetical protein
MSGNRNDTGGGRTWVHSSNSRGSIRNVDSRFARSHRFSAVLGLSPTDRPACSVFSDSGSIVDQSSVRRRRSAGSPNRRRVCRKWAGHGGRPRFIPGAVINECVPRASDAPPVPRIADGNAAHAGHDHAGWVRAVRRDQLRGRETHVARLGWRRGEP